MVLRGRKLNLTIVLRGGAFEKPLELDKLISAQCEAPCNNTYGSVRERDQSKHRQSLSLTTCSFVPPWGSD
jgi:hypothetical protein